MHGKMHEKITIAYMLISLLVVVLFTRIFLFPL